MISAAGKYLEFDEDAKLSFSDSMKELSDVNKMSKEIVLGFNIPSAPKNDYLFRKHGLGKRIPCRLTNIQNDDFDLVFELATAKSYKISLKKNANDWIKWAANTKLCQLDFGTVVHNNANVLADWDSDRDAYKQGDSGVFPIYANMGWQANPDRLSLGDIRYATNGYHLLREAFCQKGIRFVSPVLEAHPHLWDYIYKERFWEYEGHGLSGLAGGSIGNPILLDIINHQYLAMDSVDFDNGGNIYTLINNLGHSYRNNTDSEQCLKICFKGSGEAASTSDEYTGATIYYHIPNGGGLTTPQDHIAIGYLNESNNYVLEETCHSITLQPGEYLRWTSRIDVEDKDVILNSFSWEVTEICTKAHYPNDIIPVAQILDCELTVLDYLKAYTHLFNGKMDYDDNTNILFMSCPYEVDGIEGFFKPMYFTKTLGMVITDSWEASRITEPESRRIYSFKDSSDAYIDNEMELDNRTDDEKENGVLSVSMVLGFDNDKEKKLSNPLFQPTLNALSSQFGGSAVLLNPQYAVLQFLDNLDGELSTDIGHRIFYIFNGQQIVNGNSQTIVYDNVQLSKYPTIFQELPEGVEIANNPDYTGQELNYEILYEKFYRKFLERTGNDIKNSFSLFINYGEYRVSSARTRYLIRHDGADFVGILKKKRWTSDGKAVRWEFVREVFDC
ncbi:MAG: hypothetical protein ACPG5P_02425 [Saprospiraceae bacterium]